MVLGPEYFGSLCYYGVPALENAEQSEYEF